RTGGRCLRSLSRRQQPSPAPRRRSPRPARATTSPAAATWWFRDRSIRTSHLSEALTLLTAHAASHLAPLAGRGDAPQARSPASATRYGALGEGDSQRA